MELFVLVHRGSRNFVQGGGSSTRPRIRVYETQSKAVTQAKIKAKHGHHVSVIKLNVDEGEVVWESS